MAFLIKYWDDTANKARKDMCFLKACLFTVKIHLLATPVPSAGATGQAGQADLHRQIQTFFPADMAGKK